MRILLISPPHESIGSRIPDDHLPPLGLLAIGGPLIDAGHTVALIDADRTRMSFGSILKATIAFGPEAILLGHPGSSSADPTVRALTKLLHAAFPRAVIIYGGVHPTYFWREILLEEPQIDVIVRGEGEETIVKLIAALERGEVLDTVPGIAFRTERRVVATRPAPVIADLDRYRIGWELIDLKDYSYWGRKRAVVVQFSRGCPHLCSYCGQRGFWTTWRHRNPEKFAAEIAWLHRVHGVEVFNFADENPSTGRKAWLAFLEALIAEKVDVTLVGSIRAGDIVRDRDHLHLYRKAGFERFLLGMENTDEATLKAIRKGSTTATDREAIRLLRANGILSLATLVTGFGTETNRDFLRTIRQVIAYDPDQITTLYATPHRWTPYYGEAKDRRVIQLDRRRWDYKHQVLANPNMAPWRVLAWVKATEIVAQMRPRALARYLWRKDPKLRHATRWYYQMGRRVWFHEVWNFLFRDSRVKNGPTVAELIGPPQHHEEYAHARKLPRTASSVTDAA